MPKDTGYHLMYGKRCGGDGMYPMLPGSGENGVVHGQDKELMRSMPGLNRGRSVDDNIPSHAASKSYSMGKKGNRMRGMSGRRSNPNVSGY